MYVVYVYTHIYIYIYIYAHRGWGAWVHPGMSIVTACDALRGFIMRIGNDPALFSPHRHLVFCRMPTTSKGALPNKSREHLRWGIYIYIYIYMYIVYYIYIYILYKGVALFHGKHGVCLCVHDICYIYIYIYIHRDWLSFKLRSRFGSIQWIQAPLSCMVAFSE